MCFERGELRLAFESGELQLHYFDRRLPIEPSSALFGAEERPHSQREFAVDDRSGQTRLANGRTIWTF